MVDLSLVLIAMMSFPLMSAEIRCPILSRVSAACYRLWVRCICSAGLCGSHNLVAPSNVFLSSINSLPPKHSLGWAKHFHFFKCKKPLEDFSSNHWSRRVSDLAALSMSSSCTPTRMAAMPSEIFCSIIFLMAFPALRLGFALEVLLGQECLYSSSSFNQLKQISQEA